MTNRQSPPTSQATALRWVLILTSTAYFMVILDTGALFTALPRMQRDLHAGLASLQWTVNSYGIAFAAGILTAAALGDRFGRRRVFNLGLALFTVSSAACALAPSTVVLTVARTVQGLGAAAVLPLSLTILTTAYPPQRRGLIVGIYGGLAGLAVASGPVVGGVVTEGLGWHWIFWLNVPIGLLATALATRLLPESHGAPERLDLPGVTLVTAGVVSLVWALVRANDTGWSSPEIVGTLVLGCVLLVLFVGRERRTPAPMLPLRLFRQRVFAAGNLTMFLMSGATFAAAFLITQDEVSLFAISAAFGLGFSGIIPAYAVTIRDLFPASEASWRIPLTLFTAMSGMAFGSWFAGALYDHFGYYAPAFATGVAFNVINLLIIGFLVACTSRARRANVWSAVG